MYVTNVNIYNPLFFFFFWYCLQYLTAKLYLFFNSVTIIQSTVQQHFPPPFLPPLSLLNPGFILTIISNVEK